MARRPLSRLCRAACITTTSHCFLSNLTANSSRVGARAAGSSRRPRQFSAEAVSHPGNRVQIYVSRSTDPFLNLSVEHYLLQRSGPESVVLFLYANRPCVVIGRNQNPWTEVNLGLVHRRGVLANLLASSVDDGRGSRPERGRIDSGLVRNGRVGSGVAHDETSSTDKQASGDPARDNTDDGDVLLVRRRSGGGTVFHDRGNVNWSVVCPPATFDRNKHAEMVVRALHCLGFPDTRVNERHDIVLDVPAPDEPGGSGTAEATVAGGGGRRLETFKISGSAYKLTRLRSLHHGTCLLSSPHLSAIGKFLRSPAAPYIKARGVESVRSPIRNVFGPPAKNEVAGKAMRNSSKNHNNHNNIAFEEAVVAEFGAMYGNVDAEVIAADEVEELLNTIPEIGKGYAELKSREWLYTQTPQFAFSSHPTADDPRPRPALPADLPGDFRLDMTVRHGRVTDFSSSSPTLFGSESDLTSSKLLIHDIEDWRALLSDERVGRWLNGLFGISSDGR